ncbi:MAG: hypothetical protein HYX33_01335 [Actinobacteria bacterium]|nr:hypothetical protein [Actinomycetota bacterium]
MSETLPAEVLASLELLDDGLAAEMKAALEPVVAEIGPREVAVLERLAKGIAGSARPEELNAFVRLLPVTVSRVLQTTLEPVLTKT